MDEEEIQKACNAATPRQTLKFRYLYLQIFFIRLLLATWSQPTMGTFQCLSLIKREALQMSEMFYAEL